jgi:membrane-bound lytic murein transglycosylase A
VPFDRAAAFLVSLSAALAGFAAALPSFAQSPLGGGQPAALKATTRVTQPRFSPISFGELPGWGQDDHAAAFAAFVHSCAIVIAANRAGNKSGATSTTRALLSACDAALTLGKAQSANAATARVFFETSFLPHAVVHSGPPGLLTGYYEPVVDGSREYSSKFSTPIYRRPAELVNIVEESQRGAISTGLTHGRQSGSGIVPFATRAEIEQGALKGRGLELFYLNSSVDAFFMQIQGSGRIRLPDGSLVRVSYDGKNGHPYTSIGRHLIEQGHFTAASMSLDALGAWLKSDNARGRQIMWQNKSFVFFRELKGDEAKGALGVLNIPLVQGRSLAVDASVHAIGTPIYVSAPQLTHAGSATGLHRLMVAHDVGSAIKGPERGDVYFGSGDKAGQLAGVTKHAGRLFVLLPKDGPLDTSKQPDASVPVAAEKQTASSSPSRDP